MNAPHKITKITNCSFNINNMNSFNISTFAEEVRSYIDNEFLYKRTTYQLSYLVDDGYVQALDETLTDHIMKTGCISYQQDDGETTCTVSFQMIHPLSEEELQVKYDTELAVFREWKKQQDRDNCIKQMQALSEKYPDIYHECAIRAF